MTWVGAPVRILWLRVVNKLKISFSLSLLNVLINISLIDKYTSLIGGASSSSTVVQHLLRYPKVKGSNPATIADTGRDKMAGKSLINGLESSYDALVRL